MQNYLYLTQGEGTEALSLINFNLDAGTYPIGDATDQVGELGIFQLEIHLGDKSAAWSAR